MPFGMQWRNIIQLCQGLTLKGYWKKDEVGGGLRTFFLVFQSPKVCLKEGLTLQNSDTFSVTTLKVFLSANSTTWFFPPKSPTEGASPDQQNNADFDGDEMNLRQIPTNEKEK